MGCLLAELNRRKTRTPGLREAFESGGWSSRRRLRWREWLDHERVISIISTWKCTFYCSLFIDFVIAGAEFSKGQPGAGSGPVPGVWPWKRQTRSHRVLQGLGVQDSSSLFLILLPRSY